MKTFQQFCEKLNLKKADMGDVVKDFYKSDAPKFKGKSKEKRRQMAIAAKLTAERGERSAETDTDQQLATRPRWQSGEHPQQKGSDHIGDQILISPVHPKLPAQHSSRDGTNRHQKQFAQFLPQGEIRLHVRHHAIPRA